MMGEVMRCMQEALAPARRVLSSGRVRIALDARVRDLRALLQSRCSLMKSYASGSPAARSRREFAAASES